MSVWRSVKFVYDFVKCISKKPNRLSRRWKKNLSEINWTISSFLPLKSQHRLEKHIEFYSFVNLKWATHIRNKKNNTNIIGIPLINGASALCTNGWIYILMIALFHCLLRFLTSSYGQWSNLSRFIFISFSISESRWKFPRVASKLDYIAKNSAFRDQINDEPIFFSCAVCVCMFMKRCKMHIFMPCNGIKIITGICKELIYDIRIHLTELHFSNYFISRSKVILKP